MLTPWHAEQTPPYNYTVPCVKATTAQISKGLTPPTFPALTLAKSPALPEDPPPIPGYCNAEMPNDSTLNRYVWTVAQFVNEVPSLAWLLWAHSCRLQDVTPCCCMLMCYHTLAYSQQVRDLCRQGYV